MITGVGQLALEVAPPRGEVAGVAGQAGGALEVDEGQGEVDEGVAPAMGMVGQKVRVRRCRKKMGRGGGRGRPSC